MNIDEIRTFIEQLDGVLTLAPGPGDNSPEIAWGDLFFYYAPDGVIPDGQPFATVVTKDYPDDSASHLDRPEAYRVNLAAGTGEFVRWAGRQPRADGSGDIDPSTEDVVMPHPIYGDLGWLSVVNPGSSTESALHDLLRAAHQRARARRERRES